MGLAWPGFSTARGRSCSRSTGQTVLSAVGGASLTRSMPRLRRGRCWLARPPLSPDRQHLVEMIRCVRVARATAVKARTQAANALRALVVTAPAELREQLRGLPVGRLASTAARLRPGPIGTVTAATKLALRVLGQRYQTLEAELAAVDAELDRLTAKAAPRLRRLCGVGPEIAGALLVAAGDNPERLRSEAAFSMLCGASPIPASSGKTVRHRLNRGGNRQANAALYRIVVVRLRWHQPTRDYLVRRTKEGLSKREIIRCLKRYVAREVFAAMNAPAALPDTA
jgi:transposase